MKAWIIATAVLSIATATLALPQDLSPVSSAAACDSGDTICNEGCWEPGDEFCTRVCVWVAGCRNVRIEKSTFEMDK